QGTGSSAVVGRHHFRNQVRNVTGAGAVRADVAAGRTGRDRRVGRVHHRDVRRASGHVVGRVFDRDRHGRGRAQRLRRARRRTLRDRQGTGSSAVVGRHHFRNQEIGRASCRASGEDVAAGGTGRDIRGGGV